MAARISLTARIGLALIVAPIVWLGGWAGWNRTRIWAPLEMRVSLPREHTRTAEFSVNLESDYSIALQTNIDRGFDNVPCADGAEYCQVIDSRLRAPWSVSENGKIIATGVGQPDELIIWGNQPARVIGRFHAGKGAYRLDLDIPEDRGRLYSREPTLAVYESGGKFIDSQARGALAFTVAVILVPIGFCALIAAAMARRREKDDAFIKAWPLTQPGALVGASLQIDLRRRPRRAMPAPFCRTGSSGLISATAYLAQFFAVMVLIMMVSNFMEHRASHRLTVHVVRPGVKLVRSSGTQPLRIHVAIDGVLVGSKLIRAPEFDIFLRSELTSRPPDWPVYVEGDPYLEFEKVAKAIDVIRAAGAEVVLLTPGYKAALGESGLRPTPGTTAR
jgi:biopolymer transport protein ExbD